VPPLNHVGLWVDDLKSAVDWMQKNGAAGHDVIFIHPKGNEANPISGNGVLVELVQAPKDVIEAYGKK
jgi:lactoylglutathione lyase